jgi:hypothetical protein
MMVVSWTTRSHAASSRRKQSGKQSDSMRDYFAVRGGDAASGYPAPLRVQVGLFVGGPSMSAQYRIC